MAASINTSKVPGEVFIESEAVQVLENSKNRGKGYSVKQGVLVANGELILISDADFSTPIQEFEKLHAYQRIENIDPPPLREQNHVRPYLVSFIAVTLSVFNGLQTSIPPVFNPRCCFCRCGFFPYKWFNSSKNEFYVTLHGVCGV